MWYAFSMNNDNRKKILKIVNCILIVGLTAGAVSSAVPEAMVAEATTISEVQENINKHQNELNNWNNQIADLEDEQDLIEEQIADLNAEIVNTMASIGLLEDEISQKENEIGEKQIQIEQTQAEYEAAVEREETQRQNMMDCTRMMYENNNISYITAILEGKGLADILNQIKG